MKLLTPLHVLSKSSPNSTLKCIPEDADDIYTLYSSVINIEDEVECPTIRKVQTSTSTNSSDNTNMAKMRIILAVKVEKMDVELSASCPSLRLNGRNVKESEWVKLGAYHTLDVEPGRWLKITKPGGWDGLTKHALWQAADPTNKTDIAVIALDDDGNALLGSFIPENNNNSSKTSNSDAFSVRVDKRVSVKQPKRKIGSEVERAQNKFFGLTVEGIRESMDLARIRAVILAATSADLREAFWRHLLKVPKNSNSKGDKDDEDNDDSLKKSSLLLSSADIRNKFVKISIATLDLSKLVETVMTGEGGKIREILSNTKSAREAKAIDELMSHLKLNSKKEQKIERTASLNYYTKNEYSKEDEGEEACLAVYGLKAVQRALDFGAIKTLLVSDNLLKSCHVSDRKVYGKLVEDAQKAGASILTTSLNSAPDTQLQQLTGVAAILNFPLPPE